MEWLSPLYNKKLEELSYDWIEDMKSTPQDSIYHAEGNVFIHTQMVLDELVKLKEYQELSIQDKHILYTSVIFHDVEKRSTTEEIDGRITSYGHSKKGEYTTRYLLYTLFECPFDIREQICKLVRYHSSPIWAIKKEDPNKEVINLSLKVNTKLLAILSKADMLGRICSDQQDILDRIELFIELCKENQLL